MRSAAVANGTAHVAAYAAAHANGFVEHCRPAAGRRGGPLEMIWSNPTAF